MHHLLFLSVFLEMTTFSFGKEVEPSPGPKSKAWIQYVSAVHEGKYFLGLLPEDGSPTVRVDPQEFEGRSKAIRVTKSKLVELGELQQKKITVKSLSALVEHPLDQFWDEASKIFHEDVIKDLIA